MHINDLDYHLAESAIAQFPVEPRDSAKLLVVNHESIDASTHLQIANISQLVRPGDVIVVNNTRVIRARVPITRKSGAPGEVLLLEERPDVDANGGPVWWEALCRPSKKLVEGTTVHAATGSIAFTMGPDLGEGRRLVQPMSDAPLMDALESAGLMPLPPYIHEPLINNDRYQTVFNQRPISAAAPTAGLHFTQAVMDQLQDAGATIITVELAVGLDTFRPIATELVEDHDIHSEWFRVPNESWQVLQHAKQHGNRVIAIGTTAVRALESAAHHAGADGYNNAGDITGRTRLFITPGYEFQVVDALLTNFHLPKSSLLSLLQAFMGPTWRAVYDLAAHNNYRFLSFGDAMFVERADLRESDYETQH